MNNKFKISLLILVFIVRFYYDITYVYNDCIKKNPIGIILNSILHSIIIAFMATGWMFDMKIVIIALICYLMIFLGWKIFGGCLLSMEANKICKQNKDYSPKGSWWETGHNIIVFIYIFRLLFYVMYKK
jgi:hypothetical protein